MTRARASFAQCRLARGGAGGGWAVAGPAHRRQRRDRRALEGSTPARPTTPADLPRALALYRRAMALMLLALLAIALH
ncbi:MAG: hypothetical protein R3D78_09050 [Paracoccaceae bacterium]